MVRFLMTDVAGERTAAMSLNNWHCRTSSRTYFMRCGWLVAVGALVATKPAAALEPSPVAGVTRGMSYREARERLLEVGFSGIAKEVKRSCDQASRRLCDTYPDEFVWCDGGAAGTCRFMFRYPRGRSVIVETRGAGLTVVQVSDARALPQPQPSTR
jgi:hypothetical protein